MPMRGELAVPAIRANRAAPAWTVARDRLRVVIGDRDFNAIIWFCALGLLLSLYASLCFPLSGQMMALTGQIQ